MEAVRNNKLYTIDDIYALPEGSRAELIDGMIYNMAPPSRNHQKILNYINTEINLYLRKGNGKCEVYPAPFAVFLNQDQINYVEPDISVICDNSKLNDRGCNGAPDWIIEIVSPGSRRLDYLVKLFKYRIAGVREYWIADLEKNRIMVYYFEGDLIDEYTFKDKVKVNIYEDLYVDFSKIE